MEVILSKLVIHEFQSAKRRVAFKRHESVSFAVFCACPLHAVWVGFRNRVRETSSCFLFSVTMEVLILELQFLHQSENTGTHCVCNNGKWTRPACHEAGWAEKVLGVQCCTWLASFPPKSDRKSENCSWHYSDPCWIRIIFYPAMNENAVFK